MWGGAGGCRCKGTERKWEVLERNVGLEFSADPRQAGKA